MFIRVFDPWKGKFCTCPLKYSLSPYTGCEHQCKYCYITTYIPRAFECRPKQNFIKILPKDLAKADTKYPISIANSSDPYPPMEKDLELTRDMLKLFEQYDFKILLVTKSDLVARDIDIIQKLNAVVTMTITTTDVQLAARLEPYAPPPLSRINAVEALIKNDIDCMVRIDPIIPGLNDNPTKLIEKLSEIGVTTITSSTYKARSDSLKRMIDTFPEHQEQFERLYLEESEFINRSRYLPKKMRYEIMETVSELADEHGMEFAMCREGFQRLQAAKSCDGSHLLE
ncbi:MAG: radical SAM protein [Thermoplasmata archaeon]|nr:radical SAM protein [Thermoplasmata archaeon]